MRRAGACLVALAGLLLGQATWADQAAQGLEAWRVGDYGAARRHWQQGAEAGDPQAMFLLSQLYERGQGVPRDEQQALSWLRAAAEAGYAPACHNLGDRYLNGDGVPRDPARAASWWRQAAVRGLPVAQYNLGTLYYRGLGVPADPAQAAWWYREAARQGSTRARDALAALVRAGVTVRETPDAPPPAGQAQPGGEPPLPALGTDWLKRQPPGHFTVQVFASDERQAVVRFLQSHRLARQVAVYPFRKEGAVWYGVVYGRFSDAGAARAAVAELPEGVRRGRPWVRRIAELTAIIVDGASAAESS